MGQAPPRTLAPPQSTPRGVLHSALQQRLSSPPMSPQPRPQEKTVGPISPTNYPTIQQALLGPGGGGQSQVPTTSQPGSPLPSSPTATNKPTDSNLIKSLLANKVTQNMHRLQQQQQLNQGQPGQLHPGLTQQTTGLQQATEPKPSPRAKKRKASSSPTPTEPKVPAIAAHPDQPKPDLPAVTTSQLTCTPNLLISPAVPPVASSIPKEEPMETDEQSKPPVSVAELVSSVKSEPINSQENVPAAGSDLGKPVSVEETLKSENTQCSGATNCNSDQVSSPNPGHLVDSVVEGDGVNGHKPAVPPSHATSDPVCINGSKGGGKAQEPLVNGLCSPAPSESESDSLEKDSTKTQIDISQMKKDLAMVGKITEKKEQISALLNENNKQQLFGLNGVVNHMGNGDCRMVLHKDHPLEKRSGGEENPPTPAPVLENGYISSSEGSCDKPNGGGVHQESGNVHHPSNSQDKTSSVGGVQAADSTRHTGPTHSSDAQTSVSGSVQPASGTSVETVSSDLRQAHAQPLPPAVHPTTAMATPAACSLPPPQQPDSEQPPVNQTLPPQQAISSQMTTEDLQVNPQQPLVVPPAPQGQATAQAPLNTQPSKRGSCYSTTDTDCAGT